MSQVVARPRLQDHHVAGAAPVQLLRALQPGQATTNDDHVGLHASLPSYPPSSSTAVRIRLRRYGQYGAVDVPSSENQPPTPCRSPHNASAARNSAESSVCTPP